MRLPVPDLSERSLQAILLVLGLFQVTTGALALFCPGTFFDEIGRYGVENSHYVGDVGAMTLGLGVAALIAVRKPAWRAPILGLAALTFAFHAGNHAFDTGEARSETRGIVDTALLGVSAFAFLGAAISASRRERG